jgi:integrative and conjugative element protein (TIGR02256 family)
MPRLWPLALTPPDGEMLVLVAPAVQRCLEGFFEADSCFLEAGGLLMGLRRDPHLELLLATLPTRRDLRTRTHFVRRCPSHQAAATRAWNKSGKIMDYVGEWHTHPERWPRPSVIDRAELLRRSGEHRGEHLVELILGTQGIWAALARNGCYVPLRNGDTSKAD